MRKVCDGVESMKWNAHIATIRHLRSLCQPAILFLESLDRVKKTSGAFFETKTGTDRSL